MSHPRTAIRAKFLELLMGNTLCGRNVYKNRARPFVDIEGWASQLPAMVVYTDTEAVQQYTAAPLTYERRLTVNVEIHAGQDEDTDDLLDDIADQVETLIGRYNWHRDGMMFGLTSTRMQVSDFKNELIVGACAIAFEITYYSELPDPGKAAALDEFLTADNRYQTGDAINQQTVVLR